MELEGTPVGYPDFRVVRGDDFRLSLSPARLMTLALHKLSDPWFFTAYFSGESYFFEPWITVLVHYGDGAMMTGVYCVDDHDEVSLDEPSVCLLQMRWEKDKDLRQAMQAYKSRGEEGYKRYLTEGPQIDTSRLFGTGSAMSDVLEMTDDLLAKLSSGVRVTTGSATTSVETEDWEMVDFRSSDARFLGRLHYDPGSTNCPELPGWLGRAADRVQRSGLTPDDKPILSIQPSVKEVLRRPVQVQWEELLARYGDYLDD